MSTISEIDTSKGMIISPIKIKENVILLDKRYNPISFTSIECKDFIANSKELIEKTGQLQCVCEDKDGNELLSAWLSFDACKDYIINNLKSNDIINELNSWENIEYVEIEFHINYEYLMYQDLFKEKMRNEFIDNHTADEIKTHINDLSDSEAEEFKDSITDCLNNEKREDLMAVFPEFKPKNNTTKKKAAVWLRYCPECCEKRNSKEFTAIKVYYSKNNPTDYTSEYMCDDCAKIFVSSLKKNKNIYDYFVFDKDYIMTEFEL